MTIAFHNTHMGHKFFTQDVPEALEALKSIAKSLAPDTEVKVEDLWDNNEVQFARLICELVANVIDLEEDSVMESMDLSAEQLRSLYDRAFVVFQREKDNLLGDEG